MHLLHAFDEAGALIGCQCCVVHKGSRLVDASVGRMGLVDPRPVTSSTLFQLFQAGSAPLLATLVLMLHDDREDGHHEDGHGMMATKVARKVCLHGYPESSSSNTSPNESMLLTPHASSVDLPYLAMDSPLEHVI